MKSFKACVSIVRLFWWVCFASNPPIPIFIYKQEIFPGRPTLDIKFGQKELKFKCLLHSYLYSNSVVSYMGDSLKKYRKGEIYAILHGHRISYSIIYVIFNVLGYHTNSFVRNTKEREPIRRKEKRERRGKVFKHSHKKSHALKARSIGPIN